MKHRQPCTILVVGVVAFPLIAQDAKEYLKRSAQTYKQLRSLQVEAEAERILDGAKTERVKALITLYSVPPHKARVETKNTARKLQSLLISNGSTTTEYRAQRNEFTRMPVGSLALSFSPNRGHGWGEMLYDTIADGILGASIRGEQVVEVGSDRIQCAVIDVDYGVPASRYTFWISRSTGLVLRRVATRLSNGSTLTMVSTVRALTANEDIPDTVFEFHAPEGSTEIPL